MSEVSSIISFVSIRGNKIIVDGRVLLDMPDATPRVFFESAYRLLGINYPKFFKMDNLSKISFIACDILLHDTQLLTPYDPYEVGIVFQTANGSLDTDLLYHKSRETIPSPSLFVYTLPNIAIGELNSIILKNTAFKKNTTTMFQVQYVNSLLDLGRSKLVVAGYSDFCGDQFESLFYVVSTGDGSGAYRHNAENLNEIYHNS